MYETWVGDILNRAIKTKMKFSQNYYGLYRAYHKIDGIYILDVVV